jgi:hypothetical protein
VSEGGMTVLPMRRNNLRTALVLATIVLAFFAGVIVRRWFLGQ